MLVGVVSLSRGRPIHKKNDKINYCLLKTKQYDVNVKRQIECTSVQMARIIYFLEV